MEKVGRNDPCPCGSGKKFKKCCELKQQHKKINAQVLTSLAPKQETQETAKVSSLFFKKASAPKAAPEEPLNPVM